MSYKHGWKGYTKKETDAIFIDNVTYKWYWDVFGGELLEVKTAFEIPWWRRLITMIFLGSKWKRMNEKADLQK